MVGEGTGLNHVRTEMLLAGLIGCGIALSRTPRMHMEEAQAQGLSAIYRKLDMDDEPRAGMSLVSMIEAAEACGFDGLNITSYNFV